MNKTIRQLNRDIFEALAARGPGAVPSRKAVAELMQSPGWTDGLEGMFPIRERLSCAHILQLCAPLLDKLCPEGPEKGWGPFTYQYVCRLMFPENGFAPEADRCGVGAEFYLVVLQVLLDRERAALPFDPMLDFQFLTPEEYKGCDKAGEYRRFLAAWREEFIYELMRLGMEFTPFKTLSHIAGVHYIAMTAARGLAQAGVEVSDARSVGLASPGSIHPEGGVVVHAFNLGLDYVPLAEMVS